MVLTSHAYFKMIPRGRPKKKLSPRKKRLSSVATSNTAIAKETFEIEQRVFGKGSKGRTMQD